MPLGTPKRVDIVMHPERVEKASFLLLLRIDAQCAVAHWTPDNLLSITNLLSRQPPCWVTAFNLLHHPSPSPPHAATVNLHP